MDSSFIVVAKTVMENSQKLAAMELAMKLTQPEMFTLYAQKLGEFQKSNELYFQKMNETLERLQNAQDEDNA